MSLLGWGLLLTLGALGGEHCRYRKHAGQGCHGLFGGFTHGLESLRLFRRDLNGEAHIAIADNYARNQPEGY